MSREDDDIEGVLKRQDDFTPQDATDSDAQLEVVGRTAGGTFAPGHSGNRRGRPRKKPEALHEMMARVLSEKVPMVQNGKTLWITLAEAIFRAMCHKGIKDPRVGRDVFKLAAPRVAAVDQGEMDAHLARAQVALENYFARMRRQIAIEVSAEREGDSAASDNDNPVPAPPSDMEVG